MSANLINIADFQRRIARIDAPGQAIRARVDALSAALGANAKKLTAARRTEALALQHLLDCYACSTEMEELLRIYDLSIHQDHSPARRLSLQQQRDELQIRWSRVRTAVANASRALANLQQQPPTPPPAPVPIRAPGPQPRIEPFRWPNRLAS